jgi:hypothetical protein
MDPEKQSEPAAAENPAEDKTIASGGNPNSAAESVMNERDAINLLQELNRLLQPAKSKSLDEQRAKQLRKSWETLDPVLSQDSPSRAKLEEQFETLRERVHRQVEERNQEFAELEKQLADLKQHVGNDDLKSSQQLEQKIINALNRIRGLSSQRRQKVISELEALQPKIKKLASWRHWGTEQAREKIIAEIRQIHEKERDLGKIAKRIQAARKEWKQWDQSGEGGDHKLYPVFDAACSKAYEPCKAHFEAQKKQRQAASKHRREICELLEKSYQDTDWRSPDWKSVQQLIREQTIRWRKLGPADYRDRKPLAKRFDAVVSRFDGPLDRERKRNLKQRQDLIEQVEQLSQLEDTRRSIAELQQLKKQWQVTVSGKRKVEQEAWNRFTSACDAVYNRGRQAKKEFEQQLAGHLEEKRRLCEEIEAAAREKTADADSLESNIRKWRTAWKESGKAPKSQSKQIEKRFREALGKIDDHLASLRAAAEAEIDTLLFRKAESCAALEKQVLGEETPDIDSAKQSFDGLPDLPDALEAAMAARFTSALKASSDESELKRLRQSLGKRFDAINGYLLQLEINAGVESPDNYSRERMALQIGRLSAAIGKGADQEILDTRTLIEKVHTSGAVTPAQQSEIDQRFQACYRTLTSSE